MDFIKKEITSDNFEHSKKLFILGLESYQKELYEEAEHFFFLSLKLLPDRLSTLTNLSAVLIKLKKLEKANEVITKGINLYPTNEVFYLNQGLLFELNQEWQNSLVSFNQAIKIKPDYAEAYYNRGNALQELKHLEKALLSYAQAISIKPDYAEAYNNRGNTLQELKRLEEALISYGKAISIKPDYAEAYYNRGNTLQELNRLEEALASYGKAISIKPDYAEAYKNRARVSKELNRLEEALVGYRQAISIKPDYAEAYNNLGNLLKELNRLDEALDSYGQAISIKSDYAEAYYNRGITLYELKRYDEAISSYKKAISIKADIDYLLGYLQHLKMRVCCWENFDKQKNLIIQKTKAKEKVTPPLALLGLTDTPSTHRTCSETYIQDNFSSKNSLGPVHKSFKNNKIILGYFSADFGNHAVSFLIAELFETHDKDRFELIAFSFGPNVKDEMWIRISKAFDKFIDVRNKSDQAVTELSRQLGIDIAIDLTGHTKGSRTGIFAFRAAPIQLSYIGYLGTSGAAYMDYLIADKTIVPLDAQDYYSEKIIYLPSYQVNDRKRKISPRDFLREDFDISVNSFVFCCFNNSYKILPATFDGWMRILKVVEGSVLFLYADNKWVESNLKKEAIVREIEADRLIFFGDIAREEYLARYRICDLFLDTFPYNAGTTASDALWAGLPVLTMMGESFASRMAASILTSLDLTELITNSQEHYEDLAIELATNPTKLEFIKKKLEDNKLKTPLFDTPRFTKHLEHAYKNIYERYHNDLPPGHIYIESS